MQNHYGCHIARLNRRATARKCENTRQTTNFPCIGKGILASAFRKQQSQFARARASSAVISVLGFPSLTLTQLMMAGV